MFTTLFGHHLSIHRVLLRFQGHFTCPHDSGYDVLLDTPLAEHFLDFYAVSPHSKAPWGKRDTVL